MWIGAIAIRVVAAIGLLAYPRVSDSDLTGWDAERFQEIATIDGRPWVDEAVEYPPGSVLIINAIAGDTPVQTNDRIVILSLLVDLGIAALLKRWWTSSTATAYLLLGLPLVPAGLLRLDLWAALAAILALRELQRGRNVRFACWTVIGAMIKVWPVLVVVAALAVNKTRAAATAVGAGAIGGIAWLLYAGLDGPRQVLSLRDATGWQLETIGGSLTGLFTDAQVTLQNDAYRIGTLSPTLVLVSRLIAVATIGLVAVLAWRSDLDQPDPYGTTAASIMLASTAAMIVTAPLLSPQFLLWLTPFAAITWPRRSAKTAGAAILITGVTGPLFGYENLADPLPAAILLVRAALLIAVIVLVTIEVTNERRPAVSAQT